MHLFRCQHHSLTFVQLTCLQSILLTYLFPMMLLSQSLCLTTLFHLIVNFSIQDLSDLTDPTISLSGSYVAQIMWDAFESRYGYGLPSLLLMLLPLGAIFFCGMSSITSASRYPAQNDCYGLSEQTYVHQHEDEFQVFKCDQLLRVVF